MRRVLVLAGLLTAAMAGLPLASPAMAQTTTMELRSGEILAVRGNVVTARGPMGVKQFVVPEDFRFDMDGKKLSVHELKPGMRVTAMITTTETPIEATTTDVVDVEVVYTTGTTIVVRDRDTKEMRKFTTAELRDRNIVINWKGKELDPSKLRKGDRLSATIVTKLPPEIVTEQEIRAFVAEPPPPPLPPPPKPAPVAAPAPPPPPTEPAQLPKTGSSLPLVGLAGVVLVGLGLGSSVLRRLLTRG